MAAPSPKLGLWLIGAAGNVATTVAVGLAAIRKRRAAGIGLVTDTSPLSELDLRPLSRIVLGGHEISRRPVVDSAESLRRDSGLFDEAMLRGVASDLRTYQSNIRPGTALRCGRAIAGLATRAGLQSGACARSVIDRLRRDMRLFRKRQRLGCVVVVNVSSTEPPFKRSGVHANWPSLDRALSRKTSPLPASSLYAIAAIEEGMPFVNFTPSLGADVPAIRDLAVARGVGIMGSDAKTGETLLKTVLAPMFRDRNLCVESWVGHNILGNGDGFVLDSSANKAAKIGTKDGVLGSILHNRPQTLTSIEYVESLQDWKTAWDHIHFRGFLGAKMSLQFVWQGCDSILAAPLVIDLARLAEYHARQGRAGVMKHLACFFKSPMGVAEQGFAAQTEVLHRYAADDLASRKARG